MNAYGAWQLSAVLAASGITLAALALRRHLGWRSLCAVTVAVLGGLAGARLLKVAFHWEEARSDSSLIWSLDFRGLDLAGVVLGGALAGWVAARLLRLSPVRLAEAAVPGLAVGMALSKVGCWVAGCCFGKVYEGFGAAPVVRFSDAHLAEIGAGLVSPFDAPTSVFPVQLLEIMIPLVALIAFLGYRAHPSRGDGAPPSYPSAFEGGGGVAPAKPSVGLRESEWDSPTWGEMAQSDRGSSPELSAPLPGSSGLPPTGEDPVQDPALSPHPGLRPTLPTSGEGAKLLVFLATYGILKATATMGRFPDAAGDPPILHLALYLAPSILFLATTRFREPKTQLLP